MRLLPLLLVLITAPALASHLDPGGAANDEVLAGNVLVWYDATFYTDASDAAQTLQLAKLAGARKDQVGRVVPMRVVSTKGAFVEVEASTSSDCTWSQLATHDDLVKLRLFVRRADLAPALTKPFNATFANGTTLTLRPGIPLVPTADGRFALSVRGDEIVASIPATAVGHAYAPVHAKVKPVISKEYRLAPGTTVKLGDQSLKLAYARATTIERRGDSVLFSLEDRCATAQLVVPAKALRETDEEDEGSISFGGGGSRGLLELRNEHYLPAKTPLSSDGRQIAFAAKPIYLPGSSMSKSVCIERRIRIAAELFEPASDDVDNSLRLCAPATKVVHERLRSARSAHGSTSRL